MNLAAEQIKQQLSMYDVLDQYGFDVGRAGMMLCPFHEEDTPSFKVYGGEGGWHCFGCGAGGSVIDFVMKLFDLGFPQAVVRIDNDFRLGLTGKRPDLRTARKASAQLMEKGRARWEWAAQYDALLGRYARLDRVLSQYKPTAGTAPAYAAAMAKRDYLWHAIEAMQRQKDRR